MAEDETLDVAALEERIAALEAAAARLKDRVDVGYAIASAFEDDGDETIEVVQVKETCQGPLGGTSTQVTIALHDPRGRDPKYVVVNVYDSEDIQRMSACTHKKLRAERDAVANGWVVQTYKVNEGDLLH